MRVQKNSNTGEYRADLGDGNFVPARVQRNGSTGEMRVIVGDQVYPYSSTDFTSAGQELDKSTGAPYAARFAIGSAADDSMKQQRARDFFGDGVRQEPDGGISFIHPQTGQRTLVNPEGMDFGDLFGAGREIASAAAGIPAAIAGGIAGGGVGSLATGSLAASAAGAGMGQLMDAGAAKLARMAAEKRGVQPSPMQSPLDAAQEFGMETGLGTVGGMALGGLGRAAGAALNPMKQEVVQAWRNMGQQIPSIAAATGGKGGAIFENALGGMLGATGRMEGARQAGAASLQDALDTVAARVAGDTAAATPYELGDLAQKAAARSREAFKKRADEVFSDLSSKWGGQKARLTNTMQALDDLESQLMYNGQPTNTSNAMRQRLVGLLQNEMTDNNYGLLTLRGIQNARNKLNNMIGNPGTFNTADMDAGQLKYLRGALKADYRAAITDPEDLAKLDAHNQWYTAQKGMRDRLDKLLGKEDPQRLGEALLRADLTPDTAQMLEQVMLPADFAALRGGIIRQLGRPSAAAGLPEGQASALEVSSRLGNGKGAYSPEAQAALFGPDVNDPRLMAQGLANIERSANTSRTAQAGHTMGLVKGLQAAFTGGGLYTHQYPAAAAAIGVPWGLARATTSPRLINALAGQQGAVSRALTTEIAPLVGAGLGQVAPGGAAATPLESVLDPEYALRQQPPTAAQRNESYSDMLRRYGVKTSFDAQLVQ